MPALIRSSCLVATVVVALLASVMPVAAQAPRGESRVALVIGNGNYRETPLRNPVNDVRAVAKALRELGFDVLAHENANKRTMETAIIEFGRRLTDGGVGFFYYAGHGLQVRGHNYLVPIDADIDSEAITRIANTSSTLRPGTRSACSSSSVYRPFVPSPSAATEPGAVA